MKGSLIEVKRGSQHRLKPTMFANWKKRFLASAPQVFEREHAEDTAEARIAKLARLVCQMLVLARSSYYYAPAPRADETDLKTALQDVAGETGPPTAIAD
jgi:hypothetical protein